MVTGDFFLLLFLFSNFPIMRILLSYYKTNRWNTQNSPTYQQDIEKMPEGKQDLSNGQRD